MLIKTEMNIDTKIICYENGLLEFDEIVDLYKYLFDSNLLFKFGQKDKKYFETFDYLFSNGYII
jgi:hypothetical protein